MTTLPLPSQTLARLRSRAESGHDDARVLLHLIARADKGDQDVAKFVDSYSSTIAALCRRLEALEPVAGLRHPVEDAEATESDSVADAVQRITDYAAKAGLTAQDWAKAFSAAPPVPRQAPSAANDPPAAPDPVEPEIEVCKTCDGEGTIDETLGGWPTDNPAATCPDCDGVGEPRRLHRQAPAAPTPPPTAPADGLVERVANAMGPSTQAAMDAGELPFGNAYAAIREVAAWLDTRGCHGCSYLLREEIDR